MKYNSPLIVRLTLAGFAMALLCGASVIRLQDAPKKPGQEKEQFSVWEQGAHMVFYAESGPENKTQE